MEQSLDNNTATLPASTATDDHERLVHRRRAASACAPLLVLLPITAWSAISAGDRAHVPALHNLGARADALRSTIDPNYAPWHELTALPQIGEVTARSIVAFRDAQTASAGARPAFTRAHDLQRVRGVGPKTVARVQPYLRFDPPPSPASAERAGE